jgi:iron complex transport system substrate-binding protein
VVTLDDNSTETLLALGLKDRIVGAVQFDTKDSMWAATKQDFLSLNIINKPNMVNAAGYPSKETLIAQNPDLVTSVYESAFDAAYGPATHDALTKLGINSYQTLQDCEANKPQTDFSLLFDDIRNYGVIFDVQPAAEALISRLESRIAAAQESAKSAALGSYVIGMHDGEKEHPGTMGVTTTNAMITLAGSKYAFINDDRGTSPVSWEVFVKRDPQVIWVLTDLGNTATQIESGLSSDPRVSSVTAVQKKAYVVVSYNDAVGSPRAIDGLEHLVNGLIALKQEGRI